MATIHECALESKICRVLRALLQRPHTSRELELSPVFDHCSHSTVADLRAEGLEIDTRRVTVTGYGGAPAYIALWSIPDRARDDALRLLADLGARRRGGDMRRAS